MKTSSGTETKTCPCCGTDLSGGKRPSESPVSVRMPSRWFSGNRQWVIWAGSLAVWLFITLVATFAVLQMYRAEGGHLAFSQSMFMQLSQMMPYALLTPFVFALVARFPIRRENWIWVLVLYLVGGAIFTLVHVGLRGATPYGVFDSKTHAWHSAAWDYQTHKFHIHWPIFKRMFENQSYDDIVNTYVPILFIAYVVSYYSKLKEREKLTSQLEIQLTKANLQMLKSQLQPHFLFNTMHSISGLMFQDVHAADRMMTRLSELLRMSLEEGTEQITTLNHELEFVNGYLEIEKMRLGDRLKVDLKISPETLDAEVPHLLLQPLVENAIQHGIAKVTYKGEVTIASRRDEGTLWLTISDNGPGFNGANGAQSKSGIGIGTSRERLQTLYGDDQRLEFRAPQNGGTEVTICIPFRPIIDTHHHKE